MLRKNDQIKKNARNDFHYYDYEWECPNRGCKYISQTILKVTCKVNRLVHRQQCEHKR